MKFAAVAFVAVGRGGRGAAVFDAVLLGSRVRRRPKFRQVCLMRRTDANFTLKNRTFILGEQFIILANLNFFMSNCNNLCSKKRHWRKKLGKLFFFRQTSTNGNIPELKPTAWSLGCS